MGPRIVALSFMRHGERRVGTDKAQGRLSMEGIFGGWTAGSELEEMQEVVSGDERLLWVGKPVGGIRFLPGDLLMIPFSLMWGGFAFFWEYMVLTSGAPFFMALWGVPFVLVGAYMIAGRFVLDAFSRSRTFYGVTDRRAIIVKTWPSRNVQSILLSTLTELDLKGGSGGSEGRGTITFGSAPFGSAFTGAFSVSGWPGTTRYAAPSFVLVPEARHVYDLIRRAQAEAMQNMQGAAGAYGWAGTEDSAGAQTRGF
jgi:hypothetical protein